MWLRRVGAISARLCVPVLILPGGLLAVPRLRYRDEARFFCPESATSRTTSGRMEIRREDAEKWFGHYEWGQTAIFGANR